MKKPYTVPALSLGPSTRYIFVYTSAALTLPTLAGVETSTRNTCSAASRKTGKSNSGCSTLFSRAGMSTMTESSLGRNAFIWLTRLDHSPSLMEIRAATPVGTEARTTEESYLLTGFLSGPWLAIFLTPPEVTLSRVDWALPQQSLIKKIPSQTCLQANLL